MPKFPTLAFLVLLPLSAAAETVLWKGSGTVTDGTGVFFRADLPPEAPVTIRVTYDDQAVPQIVKNLPFPGEFIDDYRTNIDLNIAVTIGPYRWVGTIGTATPFEDRTFLTSSYNYARAETLNLVVSSEDEGSFSAFPFRLDDSSSALGLDVRGSNNTFLDPGITPSAINLEALSSIAGTITTGVGNELTFSIDPESFEVLFEKDEVVPPTAPMPTLAVTPETISLTWQSDFRFRYRIETTDDLASETWTVIETRNGTDTVIARDYERAEVGNYFRIVAIQRPE